MSWIIWTYYWVINDTEWRWTKSEISIIQTINKIVETLSISHSVSSKDLAKITPEYKNGDPCCARWVFRQAWIAGISIPLNTANGISEKIGCETGFKPNENDNFWIIHVASNSDAGIQYGHMFCVRKSITDGIWYCIDPYWPETHMKPFKLWKKYMNVRSKCFHTQQSFLTD